MSKAWGGVGAWALDAERAEAEENERAAAAEQPPPPAHGFPSLGDAAGPQSFPSLREAAASRPKKKKPVPLSQFVATTGSGGGGGFESRGLTPDEMRRLPTGPRERSAEELEHGRLGGGFRTYGGGGGPRGGSDSSWGGGRRPYGGGGLDDEPRRIPPARSSDLDLPSRADEADDWAAGKKSFVPPPPRMDSGRQDRYDSFGVGGSSRADEVDNWSSGKKPLPSRSPGFGSGFRDSPAPSDSDRWGRAAAPMPNNGERPRLVLDPPKGEAGASSEQTRTRSSPFGSARPREEVLAEKGVDWRKMDSEIEIKKGSRPTSSHSSRPSSAQSSRPGSPGPQPMVAGAAEGATKAREKVNPFGDAKPREVLLEEKGKDWRKIDLELEHRRVDRPETKEEKNLKEEINQMKRKLSKETKGNLNGEAAQISTEELGTLQEQILQREKYLELLMRRLDDNVRFGQKPTNDVRTGSGHSGAGRISMYSERLSSQSGISEESQSVELLDRPRSRGGMEDSWAKPMDDRRGFEGGRESGLFSNRSVGRSKSREGW